MVKLKISGLFMGEGNSYPLSEIIKTDKYLPFTIYHLSSIIWYPILDLLPVFTSATSLRLFRHVSKKQGGKVLTKFSSPEIGVS